jgi:hypothetical protein
MLEKPSTFQKLEFAQFFESENIGAYSKSYLSQVLYGLGFKSQYYFKSIIEKDWLQIFIAGGAIRRTLLNQNLNTGDFDFYFNSEDSLKFMEDMLKHRNFLFKKKSQYAIEYMGVLPGVDDAVTVQLIHFKYFYKPEKIIKDFDFTVCQFVIDLGEGDGILYCGERSLWDLGRKKLVLNNLERPISIMRRIHKYLDQGFTIDKMTYYRLLDYVCVHPECRKTDIDY